ncbi:MULTISPECIES: alpha-L-arabinofuranosidase C-terminal domain-containing protein [unclassified Paraflavitalea]|uniref:alpha-L-arabinofuranosidase C-terminal domain-containing protein n=1 Tax=unclassified Paraflavitalea TaxID=2798305 RepID=UPI003D3356F9
MKRLLTVLLASFLYYVGIAQTPHLVQVDATAKSFDISPNMWGIFFEDINFAADGGIYAEMVKNRSFQFNEPLMGWDIDEKNNRNGIILIMNQAGANSRYAQLRISNDSSGFAFSNEGFRGMGFKEGQSYQFSIDARLKELKATDLTVCLLDSNKKTIGKASIKIEGNQWKTYTATIKSSATNPKGSLLLHFSKAGNVDVDMISLFPTDTWKNRPGGLRRDLVQLLANLKPGFIRFPGGCIVEGRDLSNRYQWKQTVGALRDRVPQINRWNTEFKYRDAPDYFQSYGLGFYEYFLLAEDIGASPLPILNCGMACQFNTAELVQIDDLQPYIQDALDLIEFAKGDAKSKWGSLRAQMGHPAPFELKFMGVGNEQWGEQYLERYTVFADAIHKKYPEIQLVSSVGPFSGGDLFNYLNPRLRKLGADILDEHYYAPPSFFFRSASRYDNYDRNGPKIFAGEYASHIPNTDGMARSTWFAAMSEAAFMTGLERNADVVRMASYAPLLAHADAWQWSPDLIWFNSLWSIPTANYFVQQMYSTNRGTHGVKILENNQPLAGKDSLYASAVVDTASKELIIKIVNTLPKAQPIQFMIKGTVSAKALIKGQVLKNNIDLYNTFAKPTAVTPEQIIINSKGNSLPYECPPYSFTVLKIPIDN